MGQSRRESEVARSVAVHGTNSQVPPQDTTPTTKRKKIKMITRFCRMLARAISLSYIVCLAGSFAAAPAFAAEPVIHRDLPYAEPKNERQSLDVFAPAGGKDHPVIVWIHGGGWQRGDKSGAKMKPAAFVAKGCVFVAINYRFVPVVTIKEMAGDVAKAIRWTQQNARQHGGDPNSIFVMGHSAGAQLAALVCTDDRYVKAEGMSLHMIKGCVPVDGDSYYPALQIDTADADRDGKILGGARRAASYRLKFPEGLQKELSSVLHVAKDKGIPPFMILHVADYPESGTALQSQILAKVLHDVGVPVKVVSAPGKTHVALDSELGEPGDKPTQALFEFVDSQMRSSRPPGRP